MFRKTIRKTSHFIKTTLILGTLTWSAAYAGSLTGMITNWHLDEESGQRTNDLSGNNLHGQLGATNGTDSSDPVWILRNFDNAALKFDEGDYIKVLQNTKLQPARLSVEAWVKMDTPSDPTILPTIVAKGGSPLSNGCAFASYALYSHGNNAYFYVSNGSSYAESPTISSVDLTDGQWHHLVGTYDRQNVKLYIDGIDAGGTPATFPINYSTTAFPYRNLYIGDFDGDSNHCTDYNSNFSGMIDEVRIWNRALTASEVGLRYNNSN